LFNHKSFPGVHEKWADQAKKHAGQLQIYRDAIVAEVERVVI